MKGGCKELHQGDWGGSKKAENIFYWDGTHIVPHHRKITSGVLALSRPKAIVWSSL